MNKKQAPRRSEKTFLWHAIGFATLLLLSLVLIGWTVIQADRELRANLLQQTRLVAQAQDIDHIKALSGTEADLKTSDYQQLKKQLSDVRSTGPKCRYVYLVGRKADGAVFFFVDTQDESEGSKETSPPAQPGEAYEDASDELRESLILDRAFVEGPLPDKWGVWVSALVSITDSVDGKVIAVLGMDFDARDWKWNVAAKAALPAGLVLVLMIGMITVLLANLRPSASPKPVLRRLLPVLTVLLLLLVGGFFGLLVKTQRARVREISLRANQEGMGHIGQLLAEQSKMLAAVQETPILDANLTAALKAGDRERLLTTCRPLLEKLHARYGVTHFYFSDTNRVCILRVHNPEKYGDRLDRFTAREAERIGETASGIELGPLGTFTLRVVRPVFDSGRVIGYLELGKEIEDVLKTIDRGNGIENILLIRKNALDRSQWEAGMRMLDRKSDWNLLPDYAVSYSSILFPKEAEQLIGGVLNASDDIFSEIQFDRKDWLVMVNPMIDASGQEAAKLFLLQDVTALKAANRRLLIVAGSGASVLLAALLGLVFVLLRRTDISLLAQQEGLRKSEERYRLLLQHLPVGVVVHAADTSVLLANETATRILGLSLAQMQGKVAADPAWRFVREDGRPMPVAEYPVSRVLATSQPVESTVMGIDRSADSDRVWVLVNAFPQLDVAGQVQQIKVTLVDVTERQYAEKERDKLQDQLAQFEKLSAIGHLAGGVAHDYNNVLQIVLGHTEIALYEMDPSNPSYPHLLEIQKAGRRSADITRQLLAYARKQPVSPVVLDLNETMEGILKMIHPFIGENIDLVWMPGDGIWPVKIDPSQVNQIVLNLCVNARQAIDGVGKIIIETDNVTVDKAYCVRDPDWSPGDYVLLKVSDSGCGMSRETLSRAFEPFFTTKGVGEGTGLGLATVYGIVKQNCGSINVYSEPEHGTVFSVYLPRNKDDVSASEEKVEEKLPVSRGETVLLVEDEIVVLGLGKILLEGQGYTVLSANSPLEALNIAETHEGEIHLLLTDVVMPGMNGRDLSERLHKLRPDIKTVFMSGYEANSITGHAALKGSVHFLQKPFTLKDLAVKVREALDQ